MNDLKLVARLDNPHCSYEWETIEVYQNENKELFYRAGYGCSCDSIEDIELQPMYSLAEVVHQADKWGRVDIKPDAATAARADFLADLIKAYKSTY